MMKSYREQAEKLRETITLMRREHLDDMEDALDKEVELRQEILRLEVEWSEQADEIAVLQGEIERYQKDAAAKGILYFNASGFEVKGPTAQPDANPEEA